MKKTLTLTKIIALTAAVVFTMTACVADESDEDNPPLSGTYTFAKDTTWRITFSDPLLAIGSVRRTDEIYMNNHFTDRQGSLIDYGVYYVSDNKVILIYDDGFEAIFTIVNSTTLRDPDGDLWVK